VRVIGIDGCRGGWLAVSLDDDGSVGWEWTADAARVLRADADAVAIDIPIGLPEAGARGCDRAARAMLGRRGVSVFAAPVRAVLECATYADARAVLAGLGGASMSAQAFGIVAAVRAVDDALGPADEARIVEAHPEVAFTVMAGAPVLPGKRTAAGVAVRLALLSAWLPTVLDALADVPVRAGLDDALDALACAWVARRWLHGSATVLGDGSRDRRGLLMRIVA
jgi:predicted RNase H-like nuclease